MDAICKSVDNRGSNDTNCEEWSGSGASKGGVKVGGIFPNNSPYIRDP